MIGRFSDDQTVAREVNTLSISLKDPVANVQLPYTTMEGIWKKAASLVSELNATVPAPGLGPKETMVKSKSGTTPHLISVNGVKYECDDKCPQFKSIKLCSHTVAVSEVNGELKQFINWFKTKGSCDSPNLMELRMNGMPAGAGRKPGKVTKKKQTSKCAVPSDDNRLPLDTNSQSQPIIQRNCDPNSYCVSTAPELCSTSTNTAQWQSPKLCITKWIAINK